MFVVLRAGGRGGAAGTRRCRRWFGFKRTGFNAIGRPDRSAAGSCPRAAPVCGAALPAQQRDRAVAHEFGISSTTTVRRLRVGGPTDKTTRRRAGRHAGAEFVAHVGAGLGVSYHAAAGRGRFRVSLPDSVSAGPAARRSDLADQVASEVAGSDAKTRALLTCGRRGPLCPPMMGGYHGRPGPGRRSGVLAAGEKGPAHRRAALMAAAAAVICEPGLLLLATPRRPGRRRFPDGGRGPARTKPARTRGRCRRRRHSSFGRRNSPPDYGGGVPRNRRTPALQPDGAPIRCAGRRPPGHPSDAASGCYS